MSVTSRAAPGLQPCQGSSLGTRGGPSGGLELPAWLGPRPGPPPGSQTWPGNKHAWEGIHGPRGMAHGFALMPGSYPSSGMPAPTGGQGYSGWFCEQLVTGPKDGFRFLTRPFQAFLKWPGVALRRLGAQGAELGVLLPHLRLLELLSRTRQGQPAAAARTGEAVSRRATVTPGHQAPHPSNQFCRAPLLGPIPQMEMKARRGNSTTPKLSTLQTAGSSGRKSSGPPHLGFRLAPPTSR